MAKCTVVNLRTSEYDVYIGRPSEFGNPYPIDRHGREKCIELYRQSFYDRIDNDPAFKTLVLNLAGKKLGCFCSPKACHGDIIAEYVNSECCPQQLTLIK
jgi:hypothetical protein